MDQKSRLDELIIYPYGNTKNRYANRKLNQIIQNSGQSVSTWEFDNMGKDNKLAGEMFPKA